MTNKKNIKLDISQAIASIGRIELMNLFSQTFMKYKLNISQILLTLEDTEERRRSLNAKRTFENLFRLDFIPIVNENDTIATSEIKYGDNDRLASRVAQITNADSLILLSGLYQIGGFFFKIRTLRNIFGEISEFKYLNIFISTNLILLIFYPLILFSNKINFIPFLSIGIFVFGIFKKSIVSSVMPNIYS